MLGEIQGYTDKWAIQFMLSKLEDLPHNSTVYFIGRYQFDSDLLKESGRLRLSYNNISKVLDVKLPSRPDLRMAFYTAHRSKGLQADFVFIINNRASYMGFPSKVQNPPLIDLLLEKRTPTGCRRAPPFLCGNDTRKNSRVSHYHRKKTSSFALELKSRYQDEMRKEAFTCPLCGAPLAKRNGQYGAFYGCTNYRTTGCKYTRNISRGS